MLHALITICLLIAFSGLKAQTNLKDNIGLLDSLASAASVDICRFVKAMPADIICLSIASHPAAWLIENNIARTAAHSNLVVKHSCDDKIDNIKIFIQKFSIEYGFAEADYEKLVRHATIELSATIEMKNGSTGTIPDLQYQSKDIVNKEDVSFLENSTPYDFAKSSIPEPPKSLLETIVEPVVAIVSAAVVVLLFFTVRSN